jgi:far upstream element-binding protein
MILQLVQSRNGPGDRFGGRGRGPERPRDMPPADGSAYGFTCTLQLVVPNDKVGLVIGRGGSTIKMIQDDTGAHIQIPQQADGEDPNYRTITISASSNEAAEAAQGQINGILAGQHRGDGPPPQALFVSVPEDRVGLVIGKGGSTIKDLQARTQTRIQVPTIPDPGSNPPTRTVAITGHGEGPKQVSQSHAKPD